VPPEDIRSQVGGRLEGKTFRDGRAAAKFSIEVPDRIDAYVPWGTKGLLVPERFGMLVRDVRYPIRLEIAVEDGRPVCISVSRVEQQIRLDSGELIQRGPAISGTFLRNVPLDRLMRDALDQAAIRIAPVFDLLTNEERLAYVRAAGSREGRRAVEQVRRAPRGRGARLPDDLLRDAAKVYGDALERGDAPVQAVLAHFHLSRPTAGRWVGEARRRGFLPPTEPRKPRA
jgi:hypothetical protein